jgi:hypothetical protein
VSTIDLTRRRWVRNDYCRDWAIERTIKTKLARAENEKTNTGLRRSI